MLNVVALRYGMQMSKRGKSLISNLHSWNILTRMDYVLHSFIHTIWWTIDGILSNNEVSTDASFQIHLFPKNLDLIKLPRLFWTWNWRILITLALIFLDIFTSFCNGQKWNVPLQDYIVSIDCKNVGGVKWVSPDYSISSNIKCCMKLPKAMSLPVRNKSVEYGIF